MAGGEGETRGDGLLARSVALFFDDVFSVNGIDARLNSDSSGWIMYSLSRRNYQAHYLFVEEGRVRLSDSLGNSATFDYSDPAFPDDVIRKIAECLGMTGGISYESLI